MTSSVLNEDQLTLVKPDDGIMMDRGESVDAPRDMDMLRQQFAPVQALDAGTKYIEEGQATFVDPGTDRAVGPAGIGESLGNVELVRVVGEQQKIPKYVHGFSLDIEDREVDDSFVTDMRDAILTLFDFEADYAFFQGLNNEAGTEQFPGVFEWLQDNAPSENIIDCSDFDPSSGDLAGVPANIIKTEAYSKASGVYVNNTWDMAVAKAPVWAQWNQLGTFDGATVESQWDMVSQDTDSDGVGVRRRMTLPNNMGIPSAPGLDAAAQQKIAMPTRVNDGYDSDLSDMSGYTDDDDVMFLIPDHGGDFYELYEQSAPDVRGPIEKEGWKERFEYKWRAGVVYGQNNHLTDTDKARDLIVLENVTALFDNA